MGSYAGEQRFVSLELLQKLNAAPGCGDCDAPRPGAVPRVWLSLHPAPRDTRLQVLCPGPPGILRDGGRALRAAPVAVDLPRQLICGGHLEGPRRAADNPELHARLLAARGALPHPQRQREWRSDACRLVPSVGRGGGGGGGQRESRSPPGARRPIANDPLGGEVGGVPPGRQRGVDDARLHLPRPAGIAEGRRIEESHGSLVPTHVLVVRTRAVGLQRLRLCVGGRAHPGRHVGTGRPLAADERCAQALHATRAAGVALDFSASQIDEARVRACGQGRGRPGRAAGRAAGRGRRTQIAWRQRDMLAGAHLCRQHRVQVGARWRGHWRRRGRGHVLRPIRLWERRRRIAAAVADRRRAAPWRRLVRNLTRRRRHPSNARWAGDGHTGAARGAVRAPAHAHRRPGGRAAGRGVRARALLQ